LENHPDGESSLREIGTTPPVNEQITSKPTKSTKPTKNTKNKDKEDHSQHGHEAIRPTDISVTKEDVPNELQTAYDIIWKHAVASICSNWEGIKTTVEFTHGWHNDIETTKEHGRGWRYIMGVCPPMEFEEWVEVANEDTEWKIEEGTLEEQQKQKKTRLTEQSLVRVLEEKNIGRPSTFAQLVSRIQDKG